MKENGPEKLFDLINWQKWQKLFTKSDLVFKSACREFHKNLKVNVYGLKNDVACSMEVWDETKFCKPLEITRKFSNDETLTKASQVKLINMKPFQRLLHMFVMKYIVLRFGKRDLTSFMDLTYMDYLLIKKKVNLPRVIIRHMAYAISIPQHELPYRELLTRTFEAFEVPLNDKKGDDPVRTDYFEETFLTMFQLKREQGVWWLSLCENRRRDDVFEEVNAEAENDEAPAENVEVNEGENLEENV
ncbi:hypothetical protein Dimus_033599 [Dionaea muscipula]